ncbi:hypothetical protein SAMN02745196_02589 [Clostridium collagenovorans DSM 3089]|uniref:Uncharacterized protein n=1 Tax=Clostridium collagenovorans DSM 3089 TaxID=1121306 RepID=A0A1M5Y1V7_9CLOT|nr:hypothetical protein [Clostridium collagenovorans]SHI06065.1 hypothetical protein SAMN02745196_02589 [Clostridium collagenovorans DSM 3089]
MSLLVTSNFKNTYGIVKENNLEVLKSIKTADRIIVLKDGVAYEGEETLNPLSMVDK